MSRDTHDAAPGVGRSFSSGTSPGLKTRPTSGMSRMLLALVVGAALAASVHANENVPTDLAELVAGSGLIVRGRVTDVQAIRLPDRELSSAATVAVATVLKGAVDRFVSVIVPGGELGRTRTVMVGAPRLRAGDDAVFFLARGPDGFWRPIGLSAGVFRVQAGPSGTPMVRPPLVPGRTASVGRVMRGDRRRGSLAVEEFEQLIRLSQATRRAQPVRRRP